MHAPNLASRVRPGQFVNIRINESLDPLLRRPFSVYRTTTDTIEIIFNIVGKGTALLAEKREGDLLDLLGPLGVPFTLDDDRFAYRPARCRRTRCCTDAADDRRTAAPREDR